MASGRRSGGGNGRRGGSPGCLLVLAALVVILMLFLLNLGKIRQTISSTNFNTVGTTPRGLSAQPSAPSAPSASSSIPAGGGTAAPASGSATPAGGVPGASAPGGQGPAAASPAPVAPAGGGQAASGGAAGSPAPRASSQQSSGGQGAAATAPQRGSAAGSAGQTQTRRVVGASQPGQAAVKTRPTSLYFIRIDSDGSIVRREVTRELPASDAPLTDALQALLEGPTTDELREHLMSLIPQGTKLLGVEIQGTTAYVNFNEAFMYNHYGIEGYAGQLKQIVYTATSFPTVRSVQILINGQLHNYLGGEGVFIGRPLSRDSF